MPKRTKAPLPTDGELEILTVLWEHGPSTVRQVNNILNEKRRTGYTTTLKLMQIMTQKGLLVRDTSRRPQIYEPKYPQDVTQRELAEDLMEKAFGGSAKRMIELVLGSKGVSKDELEQIEQLVDDVKQSGSV